MIPATVHACAVLVGESGILIRGPSGSGKSALVAALIDGGRAWLVADDRVVLAPANGRLLAAVPPSLAGLAEIRGQGIWRRAYVSPVVIRLVVDLLPLPAMSRLPAERDETAVVEAVELPRLVIAENAPDGAARVRLRLAGPRDKSL
jgi:serine kinase of HPr protein (carbohydrate metabolism regulator)